MGKLGAARADEDMPRVCGVGDNAPMRDGERLVDDLGLELLAIRWLAKVGAMGIRIEGNVGVDDRVR